VTARRNACPGLADPMPTGDGLLARLAVTRALSLDAFAALCAAAQTHGNGIVEITSRGSIQVRGLTPPSAPDFAAAVEALAIADPTEGRVLANPLAGLDPNETMDVSALADRLRKILIETGLVAALAPKVSVVIDGGGAFALDAIPADVRLRAEATGNGVRFELALADDKTVGAVTPECAVKAITELLKTIGKQGPTRRARDVLHLLEQAQTPTCKSQPVTYAPTLPPVGGEGRPHERSECGRGGGAKAWARDVRNGPPPLTPPRHSLREWGEGNRAAPIGMHGLRDCSVALGIGFPFGHSDAATLETLIDEARSHGAAWVRPAPGRVLLVIGLAPAQAARLAAAAQGLGFIVAPDDPRLRVVACAGAPVCAAAQIPARALAPAIAAAAAHFNRQATIHISGCAKGCAHPGPAALTIVGIDGQCGIVRDGTAREAPHVLVDVDDLPASLGRRELQEAGRG
jgi:precorrin-3B synthase